MFSLKKTKQTITGQNFNGGVYNESDGWLILRKPVSFSISYLIIKKKKKKIETKVHNYENSFYVSSSSITVVGERDELLLFFNTP